MDPTRFPPTPSGPVAPAASVAADPRYTDYSSRSERRSYAPPPTLPPALGDRSFAPSYAAPPSYSAPMYPSYGSGNRDSRYSTSSSSYSNSYSSSSGSYGRDSDLGSRLQKQDWDPSTLSKFEKDFYQEHPAVTQRTAKEVELFRAQQDVNVEGRDVPKPIQTFEEASFPDYILQNLLAQGFSAPTAIQSNGWPAALKGRDVVGLAETGSGMFSQLDSRLCLLHFFFFFFLLFILLFSLLFFPFPL